MANLFFDFPCTATCSEKLSSSQSKGKSADAAGAAESFESVVKKLLANDDPDAQADASAVATANAAASTTEFVVAPATGSDGETSERQDTDWAAASSVVDAMPQDAAGDASDVRSQGDAMAMPVDPLLSQQFGPADGLVSALRDDASQGDIDAVAAAAADAAADTETAMEGGVMAAGAETHADLSSDAPSDVAVSNSVSNVDIQAAEARAAESRTPLDDRSNANQRERAEQAPLPDDFASSTYDHANSQAGAVPSQVDRGGDAAAEAGNGEPQDDRWESARIADDAAAISGIAEGLQEQAVVGADSVDGVEGLTEPSGPVSGVATPSQTVESAEPAESNSRVADRFDSEVTSNERDRANDVDAAADHAVTEELAGQNAQAQIASGLASDSAAETVPEKASALGAIQPMAKESTDDSESLDMQDAGELFVDSDALESASIDTENQTELGGQPSSRGDSFDAMASGEPIDVIPEMNEQASVVPIDSPLNAAAEMSVDQEILETLSLEEFISQSPASPEAVKKTAEVINDAMRSSLQLEGQTVRVEIHPAELGTLKIQVTQSDQAIETQIIATEFVTSELLTGHRDQLMEALSDLGFETSDVNISYDDQSSTESDGRQPPAELRYQSKPETTQTQGSRASVSGGGVNIVA